MLTRLRDSLIIQIFRYTITPPEPSEANEPPDTIHHTPSIPLRIRLWTVRYIDLLPLMRVMCRAKGTSQLIFIFLSLSVVHSSISAFPLIPSTYHAILRPFKYHAIPMLFSLLKSSFVILDSICRVQHWLGSNQQPWMTGSLFEAMPGLST